MAANVAGSIVYSNRAAKRTARSMRNLSSAKRCSGSPIVRMIPASRSFRPPTKSSTSPLTGSSSIPLMVKSRRATSSCGSRLNRTSSGCRPSEYPISLRKVATSTRMRSGTARRRHQHYTELHSHGISLRKYPHDLLRRRVRGHVVVFRFAPQQKIAHASAHQIGLKAPLAQGLHN